MDPLTGAAALGAALKAAMDITNGLLQSGGGAKFNAQIIELQRIIFASQRDALASQEAQFSLLQEKRALEAKLAEFERWDAEKKKYALVEIAGVFARAIKPEAQGSEPFHLLCEKCFQHGNTSLWHETQRLEKGARVYECAECKTEYVPRGRLPKTIEQTTYDPLA